MAKRKTLSHKRVKFSRYSGSISKKKRKRVSIGLWWLIPASALLAFILALLLGNCLGRIADAAPEPSSPSLEESAPEELPPFLAGAKELDGVFVTLSHITDNTYAKVSEQIPEGTKAISLMMFDGVTPRYYSEAAKEMGWMTGDLTLKNIFRYPNENDVYVSVSYPSRILGNSLYLNISSEHIEVPMIKELCDAGADEVIIGRCEGTLNDAFIAQLIEYVAGIKAELPDIAVGFTISTAEAQNTAMVDRLCRYVDFCAVDMSAAADGESLASLVNPLITNVLRYKMRVLISDGGTLDNKYVILNSFGIKNRQVVSK